jgi:hypothetical protein
VNIKFCEYRSIPLPSSFASFAPLREKKGPRNGANYAKEIENAKLFQVCLIIGLAHLLLIMSIAITSTIKPQISRTVWFRIRSLLSQNRRRESRTKEYASAA